jgi:hypothetical protein
MFNKFIERKRTLQGMKEDNLFQYLRKIFPDLEKTNQFDSSDVFSRSKNSRAELKCRGEDYDDFLIEKLKWDKLQECTEKRVLYISSSYNGVWVFDVKEIPEPKWEVQMHNKTTEFSDNTKIPKLVGFYPKELGKDITNLIL